MTKPAMTPEDAKQFRQLMHDLASQLRNNAFNPDPKRELNLDAADVIEAASGIIVDLFRTKYEYEQLFTEMGYKVETFKTYEKPAYIIEGL